MAPIYLMWIMVLILAVRFFILYRDNKKPEQVKKTNDGILFFGSLAFLIGITGQMVGLVEAFDAIQRAGDAGIAPQHVAGGLKVTFIAPVMGMLLLIFSTIIWFVFRNLKNYPSQNVVVNQ